MTTSQPFSGFKPAFFSFFQALAKNNNRAWFLQNKLRYQQQVVVPMLAFIEELRRKSFFVMHEIRPELAGKADFVDLVADTYQDCEPMMDFICHGLEIPFRGC